MSTYVSRSMFLMRYQIDHGIAQESGDEFDDLLGLLLLDPMTSAIDHNCALKLGAHFAQFFDSPRLLVGAPILLPRYE